MEHISGWGLRVSNTNFYSHEYSKRCCLMRTASEWSGNPVYILHLDTFLPVEFIVMVLKTYVALTQRFLHWAK